MTDTQRDLVLHLLRQDDWSQAVTFYCEETGADAELAREAVAELAAMHGLRRPRRWWAIPAIAAAIAACGWLVIAG